MSSKLIDLLPEVKGSYREDVLLSKTNWFNVGGKADVVFRPKNTFDLSSFLKNKPDDIPVTVIGVGSNLLVRDGGIEGVVIKLGGEFTKIYKKDNFIVSGSGALGFNLSTFAAEKNISGFEFYSGIPGTVGGALAMNAGAYGNETCSIVDSAIAVDSYGQIHKLSIHDIGYIYRGNTLPDGMIFTEATFRCKEYDREKILLKMKEIAQKRQDTQPIKSRTSGSTFKNPTQKKAWQLIDEAGCRGLKHGGAQVSEKHCNFFINTGNATASDIENLGKEVIKRVKEKTDILLQWEVQIIGKEKR